MVGFRILLVVAIPTMYFLCVSVAGLFGKGDPGIIEMGRNNLDSISKSRKHEICKKKNYLLIFLINLKIHLSKKINEFLSFIIIINSRIFIINLNFS